MSKIQINVRNQNVKKKSQQIFKSLGLDMTTAINMFLVQVVQENGLPFSVKLSHNSDLTANGMTPQQEQEILQASEEIRHGKNIVSCETWQETKQYLDRLK